MKVVVVRTVIEEVEIADDFFEVSPESGKSDYPEYWSKYQVVDSKAGELTAKFPNICAINEIDTEKIIAEW